MNKIKQQSNKVIITNKKAYFDYFFEKHLHAGIVLEGWEIKSIKANKVQLSDSYVIIKNSEAWLINTLINPLNSTSTHKIINPNRTRKILLHRKEINNLMGLSKQKGYTLIPESMYWDKNKVKLQIGLAKGKKNYDKRSHSKEHDWKIQRQRLLKKTSKF